MNKLEYFSLQVFTLLYNKVTQVWYILVSHSKGKLQALPMNIRLDCKHMSGTNTLDFWLEPMERFEKLIF